jgi:hypothetical protein
MTPKLPNPLRLEELTEQQQVYLQDQLPRGYLLSQYIDDLGSLQQEIDGLIQDGKSQVEFKEYGLAGTIFTDVSDLQDVHTVLSRGKLSKAKTLVEDLDTAVRDYMPTRLYDQMYRE